MYNNLQPGTLNLKPSLGFDFNIAYTNMSKGTFIKNTDTETSNEISNMLVKNILMNVREDLINKHTDSDYEFHVVCL